MSVCLRDGANDSRKMERRVRVLPGRMAWMLRMLNNEIVASAGAIDALKGMAL